MISIIIPTYNEAATIKKTIEHLQQYDKDRLIKEIIIVDGGSIDTTLDITKSMGVRAIVSPKKGRAAQMNYGAALATEKILYFLHADTIPPENFIKDIYLAVKQGYGSGSYRLSFDYHHWFLQVNCWFTRFDVNAVRFGDQSLFVQKDIFIKTGGYRKDLLLMEDQEIIHRLKKHGKFIMLSGQVITSARKYLDNGIYKMQFIFYTIWLLYYLGFSQQYLLFLYKKKLKK